MDNESQGLEMCAAHTHFLAAQAKAHTRGS